LSPIIEDPQVFGERALKCAARSVVPPNELSVADSSGSSYGELLQERVRDFVFWPPACPVVQPCDLVPHELRSTTSKCGLLC